MRIRGDFFGIEARAIHGEFHYTAAKGIPVNRTDVDVSYYKDVSFILELKVNFVMVKTPYAFVNKVEFTDPNKKVYCFRNKNSFMDVFLEEAGEPGHCVLIEADCNEAYVDKGGRWCFLRLLANLTTQTVIEGPSWVTAKGT